MYRAYNPNIGRWISRDPSGEGSGLNLYAYAADSPINYVDSDGLAPKMINDPGIPPGSIIFIAPDGSTFLAPPGTNFQNIYTAGQINGAKGQGAVEDFGQYDFQRNMGLGLSSGDTDFVYYPAYRNASNYAVGVYSAGAGESLNWTDWKAWGYGEFINQSSNAGSAQVEDWIANGFAADWQDMPNGYGCMDSVPDSLTGSNPMSNPYTPTLTLRIDNGSPGAIPEFPF